MITQLRKIEESHPHVEGNLITDQNSFAKDSKKKRKKQKQCNKPQFKRALVDPNPLYIPDNLLTATLKELVGQIHGDFGRASIATGTASFGMFLVMENSSMRTILMDSFHIVLNKLRFAHNLQQRRDPPLHDTNKTWSSSTTWIKPSILN